MATTGNLSVTEGSARSAVISSFANATVMADKVKTTLTLTVLIADAVPAASHGRAAVSVADSCWIKVSCTLAAMLLSLNLTSAAQQRLKPVVLSREVSASADTLTVVVAFTAPIACLRINTVHVACSSKETWLAAIAAGPSKPQSCSAETRT